MSIIIVLGIAIDLISKIIFANLFVSPRQDIVVIEDFFYFTYLKNTGAAYGLFSGNTVLLSIISCLFIVAFCVYDYFNHSNNIWYVGGMSLIISGAIGNLIDRIFLGYVRDFISIKLFSFVFNMADLFVTIGVIMFAIYLIISIVQESKKKDSKNVQDK
jgi:signal peptidase II